MDPIGKELSPEKASWLLDGQEHCVFCGHAYVLEMEYHCIDCDHPLCPGCVLEITEVTGLFCADCHATRQQTQPANESKE